MSSFDKALGIFDLFREGSISVHVEDVVQLLESSRATAYRYLGSLCDAGLLSPTSRGTYVLGPRVIELDRLMRISDPLLTVGRQVMQETSARLGLNMLLSSYYRDSIMCVDIAWPDPAIPPNYERGRPMSLFRGAMAKVILAHLSPYQLRNVALHHADAIREAGLGADWPSFRAEMSALAREGSCITNAELMQGSLGVSAPVFDPDRKILGSITFAIPEARFATFDPAYLRAQIVEAAQRITDLIAEEAGMPFPPPPDEPVPASSASTV
ncbi:IclR family transcriptional regulator C-terminal domain-containing protein [Hydrogenophaga sp.]|uniref:IclR family transcriptional regulator n=1 Tax=Hydrogenophaga sp. TaxID=1904254 RepID=UPI0026195E49|nr:IclR family transcriptional regulator C-terminal domain-containing protein [Hydrogenophaga sp.]MCW5655389.1 helix-turn-helix domain-containing protein [Hydrogenophaga sp.]